MRFEVHQSHRLEDLLAALGKRLAAEPLPPLAWETILVPAPGLARWVQLRLAERFGIAGGVRLPFFGAFLQELGCRADASGSDPFARDVLVWRLWRIVGSALHRDELGPAADYVADDPDGQKRFQLCARLATCFDDYQIWRDDVLLAFARGEVRDDLGPHARWQANLWRALLHDAGFTPPPSERRRRGAARKPAAGPLLFPELPTPAPAVAADAHRLERLRELLRDPERCRPFLPPRLSVFGAGTLPPAFVDLLQRIATHVPVDVYVPRPTPHYVGDLRARGNHDGDNALLARLGVEAREFADLLAAREEAAPPGLAPLRVEALDDLPDDTTPRHLLACLQDDIVAARDRGGRSGVPRFPLRADDSSLRVHDCHSPQRELEVVRDHVLAAFDDDPSLQPHEVLVLVPDIDRYAPYAHAVFGPVAEHLPFHVADRSPARDLPVCRALIEVLELATSRLFAFDVLHLLEVGAIRRRFGLFATDVPTLRHLVERAGIRWGRDGAWRHAHHGVPPFEENSWQQGIDRMLLGAATGPVDDLVGGVLPVADTTDGRLPLLLRFVGFVRNLFTRLDALAAPHALTEWAGLLDDLVGGLLLADDADDEQAIAHLHRASAELRRVASAARHTEPVGPVVFRQWLLETLRQSGGARGFLAGAVTVAAMLPMRTVPARLLFVCGLDDASFPRRDLPLPFDLIAAARRPGDRSRRLDDRQMFLDVLLAARDRLHLTFVGHSAKDDAPCAPSVVLAELLDHVDRTCTPPPGIAAARDAIVVRQPLQPWSRRYRSNDDPRLFTFSRGGPATQGLRTEAPWIGEVIGSVERAPTDGVEVIQLDDLLEFWHHPTRWFLKHTVRLSLPRDDDRGDDGEPFTLNTLDKYHLQDEALQRAQRGEPPLHDPLAHARASGRLPVGEHGRAVFARLAEDTERFLGVAMRHHGTGRRAVTARDTDFVITGEVDGLAAEELVRVRPAKIKGKDRVRAWLLHLVLAIARTQGAAELPPRTRVIGTSDTWLIEQVDAVTALEHLRPFVDGFRRGRTRPLPWFEHASHAYAESWLKRRDRAAALAKARTAWGSGDEQEAYRHDCFDAFVTLCMRGRDPLDAEFENLAATIGVAAHGALLKVAEEEDS